MTGNVWDYHPKLKDSMLSGLVGPLIGSGSYRDVYELNGRPDAVIKVETRGMTFSNTIEWNIWDEVRETKWAKWFAPCLQIDGYGASLIQKRTTPIGTSEWERVTELPSFLADLKPANFGWYEGRIVAHDYGNHSFFTHGIEHGGMVKIGERKHDPENQCKLSSVTVCHMAPLHTKLWKKLFG